jgi:septum formation protein
MIWNNLRDKKVILASQSPRRIALLQGMGIHFESCSADLDENYPAELKGQEITAYLARAKANYFSHLVNPKTVLITADTIVWHQNQALNKPLDKKHAFEMLQSLSGQKHQVFTGVEILCGDRRWSIVDETSVTFKELTQEEIEYYIEFHKPFDKAGSYGAQDFIGYIGIEKLEGSYYNVMGFPTHRVHEVLKSI